MQAQGRLDNNKKNQTFLNPSFSKLIDHYQSEKYQMFGLWSEICNENLIQVSKFCITGQLQQFKCCNIETNIYIIDQAVLFAWP